MGKTSSSASRQQPYQRVSMQEIYWRQTVIDSIDGTKVTYRETLAYTDSCKELLDKYRRLRINGLGNLSELQ